MANDLLIPVTPTRRDPEAEPATGERSSSDGESAPVDSSARPRLDLGKLAELSRVDRTVLAERYSALGGYANPAAAKELRGRLAAAAGTGLVPLNHLNAEAPASRDVSGGPSVGSVLGPQVTALRGRLVQAAGEGTGPVNNIRTGKAAGAAGWGSAGDDPAGVASLRARLVRAAGGGGELQAPDSRLERQSAGLRAISLSNLRVRFAELVAGVRGRSERVCWSRWPMLGLPSTASSLTP